MHHTHDPPQNKVAPYSLVYSPSARSLQLELQRIGFGPKYVIGTDERISTACATRGSSSALCKSTRPEETHRSSDGLAPVTQTLASSAVRGVVEVPLLHVHQMPLPPPIHMLTSPPHEVIFGAGRGRQLGVEEAESTVSTSQMNEQLCGNPEIERAAGFVCAEDNRLSAPKVNHWNEGIGTGSATKTSFSENMEEDRPQTTSSQGMASSDITAILLGDNNRFDHGVGASGAPGVADDVTIVDNTREDGLGLLREQWEGVDFNMSYEQIMDAEEELMNSGIDIEELREENSGC